MRAAQSRRAVRHGLEAPVAACRTTPLARRVRPQHRARLGPCRPRTLRRWDGRGRASASRPRTRLRPRPSTCSSGTKTSFELERPDRVRGQQVEGSPPTPSESPGTTNAVIPRVPALSARPREDRVDVGIGGVRDPLLRRRSGDSRRRRFSASQLERAGVGSGLRLGQRERRDRLARCDRGDPRLLQTRRSPTAGSDRRRALERERGLGRGRASAPAPRAARTA